MWLELPLAGDGIANVCFVLCNWPVRGVGIFYFVVGDDGVVILLQGGVVEVHFCVAGCVNVNGG